MSRIFFPNAAAFRKWLESYGHEEAELTLGIYKKDCGKASVTYLEAVEEALCFGWIDGVRRSISAEAYTVRFTPRKDKSQWSTVNIRHVERLTKAGRMTPAGLKAFEGAKDQPRRYSFEQKEKARFDAAAERQFRSNAKAWTYFQAQPPWYRRVSTFWVVSAKKEETRHRRLATLINDCAHERSIKPLAFRPVPKRKKKKQ
jgi:uncharacterized protein YdeI (YjbR/CyaY-like superfamily)